MIRYRLWTSAKAKEITNDTAEAMTECLFMICSGFGYFGAENPQRNRTERGKDTFCGQQQLILVMECCGEWMFVIVFIGNSTEN